MTIDQPLKRKRGSPAGSQSAKNKMDQKIALVKQRLALLDSGSSSSSTNTSRKSDKDDDDFVLMDEKLATAVAQQSIAIDCDDTVDVVPLKKIVRPSGVKSEHTKLPGVPQTHNAHTGAGLAKTTKVSAVNGQKICASVQDNCGSAMERAKEVQAKLPAEHPSFVKYMLRSHVVRSFWLGLPSDFCNKHLPKHDAGFVLEDEDGHSYDAKYLGTKQGLSAGWRGFSIKHGIKVGDVVVFQLVTSTKFKVYIIRANNFTTTDGAIGLSLEVCKKGKMSKEESSDDAKSKEEPKSSDDAKSKEEPKVIRVSDKFKEDPKVIRVSDKFEDPKVIRVSNKFKEDPKVIRVSSKVGHNDSKNLVSEAIDVITFSDSDVDFGDVTSFSNFNIVVDSLVINCKFPDHLRRTYYELCCAQNSFLHKHLLKQLNPTLVIGVIMETINIAEGIRACKAHASSRGDLLFWKKTLESFELLGMNVAFLLKRINSLLDLPAQSRDPPECEKFREIKLERARAGVKMKALESKLSNLKDALKRIDVEMEEMESNVKKNGQAFQQLATARW